MKIYYSLYYLDYVFKPESGWFYMVICRGKVPRNYPYEFAIASDLEFITEVE